MYELFLFNMYLKKYPVFSITYLKPYKNHPNNLFKFNLLMFNLTEKKMKNKIKNIVNCRINDGVL